MTFTGLTGALLVVAPTLEEAIHPELYRVEVRPTRVSLQSLYASVAQRYPGQRLLRIELGQTPLEVDRFVLDGQLLVLADPYTGRLLGDKPLGQTWTGWVKPWHMALLPGAAGEKVQSLVALGALTLLASGWILSRPNAVALPRKRAFDVHRWLGWVSTPPLTVAAVTGALLIFYAPVEHALVRWSHFTPLVAGPATRPVVRPDLDRLVASAQQALPAGVPVRIQFGQPLSVRLRQSGEPNPKGRSFVRVDTADAQVVDVEDARRVPWSVWLLQSAYRVHTGDFGDPVRAAVFTLGFAPAALWASGLRMRQRRTKTSIRSQKEVA